MSVYCQQLYEDGQRLSGRVDEFEQASKELLAVIVTADRQPVVSRLSSMVARWKVRRCPSQRYYWPAYT